MLFDNKELFQGVETLMGEYELLQSLDFDYNKYLFMKTKVSILDVAKFICMRKLNELSKQQIIKK